MTDEGREEEEEGKPATTMLAAVLSAEGIVDIELVVVDDLLELPPPDSPLAAVDGDMEKPYADDDSGCCFGAKRRVGRCGKSSALPDPKI